MYVVADAAYLYYFATCGIHQLSYVGMNAVEFSFTNRRTRGLDVEYQMYVELLNDCAMFFTLLPFQGVDDLLFVTQGVASLALG